MAVDFEKMEKFLLEKFPDEDDKDLIILGIDKLKKMSEDEYGAFLVKIDTFIYDSVREPFWDNGAWGFNTPSQKFESAAWEHFGKAHPEQDPDSDEFNEAFEDFINNKIYDAENKDLKEELIDKAYNNLDDETTDELRRNATNVASDEFELHSGIIQYLELPNALPSGFIDQ